ncbi:iron-siderophore ABC transporter substrate-binding protein [Brucella pseudogrignonensis]|uniref:Iron complex transport system substrate-binding protein n=1 Tax=Brucella pseudogrignonensis TaxID=419475 RepID=A0ABU1MCE2_9HYPH|nr:iron-siderophore ABC transporter substrate-binding protein [Brucella pseudogrignonensis]MDR6433717.1 iron complex transport system substrate-binding protein [Brucella pseudogrignonensis]
MCDEASPQLLKKRPVRLSRRQLLIGGIAVPSLFFIDPAKADDGFPVTIRHSFGETLVRKPPKRIVTIGWCGEDPVIALGEVPVGMTGYPYWPDKIADWNTQYIGSEKPVLMNYLVNYEQIAALRPDLILSVFSGIDGLAYQRLSQIAPVVCPLNGAWTSDWREQTLLAGHAMGKTSQATQLIDAVDQSIDDLRTRHPEIAGKSFALVSHFPRQNGFDVYLSGDSRFVMFEQLGLRPCQGVVNLGKAEGGRYVKPVSLEQLDVLDCDILIAWFSEGAEAALNRQPIFRTLPSVQRGTVVALEDPAEIWSVLTPTVLSIPYGFPKLVSRLAAAARKL